MSTSSETYSFQTTGVPCPPENFKEPHRNYPKLLQAIRSVANSPEKGVVVISGGPGSGKTATIAHLLSSETFHPFFVEKCGLASAFWLNCIETKVNKADNTTLSTVFSSKNLPKSNLTSRCLVILDDVYSVNVVETFRIAYPKTPCCVITRDPVSIMSSGAKLVRELGVYWLEEFVDNEIAEIISGKSEPVMTDELKRAAKRCCGSPLIASLMAENRDFFSEKRIADLPLIFSTSKPEKTVSDLYNLSLNLLESDELRGRLYSFLLFEPSEIVPLIDLQILWRLENNFNEAADTCLNFECRSVIRRYRYHNLFYVDAIFYEAIADSARRYLASQLSSSFFLTGFELLVAIKLGILPARADIECACIETRSIVAISDKAGVLKRDSLMKRLYKHPSMAEFLRHVEEEKQDARLP